MNLKILVVDYESFFVSTYRHRCSQKQYSIQFYAAADLKGKNNDMQKSFKNFKLFLLFFPARYTKCFPAL